MTMVDTDIRALVDSSVLYCKDSTTDELKSRIGAIAYDLRTLYYANSEAGHMENCILQPGESVFVACREIIDLPADILARISLRNSRIRQGFTLDAPVYQPGHHTRVFFRITNVSSSSVSLDQKSCFANLHFEKLEHAPKQPYSGVFQNEMNYSDMAEYRNAYRHEMQKVQGKVDEIKHLEKNIYTNIITLMSIFIALFSLINVNVDIAFAEKVEQMRIIVSNLVTVGSIAFLVSLIQLCTSRKGRRALWIILLLLGLVVLGCGALLTLHT